MKKSKYNVIFILSAIYIVITAVINVVGYFRLPAVMATQFSLTGGNVNRMPSSIYLIGSFAIVLVLSALTIKKGKEQQIKYFIVNTVITAANIAMIGIQM